MLVVDAHLDLAWNALQWNRDLTCSAYTIRTREERIRGPGRGQGTVALAEMRQGKVALCLATLLARSTGSPIPHVDYPSPLQALSAARGQLAYYRGLEQEGYARIITDVRGLERHLFEWEVGEKAEKTDARGTPPLGFVISMESADPILDPDDLPAWWEDGVRVIGPAHYGRGRYAGGTGTEMGLTGLGVRLLAEMERLGIILDLTHFSDQAFWEALEKYEGLVLASHNNCRALVPHQRQFSDEQLEAIFQREGVIGVAFDAWMLEPGWIKGVRHPPLGEEGCIQPQVSLDSVVNHIDHICQLAGNSDHAAIGSDLDGGFGREQAPRDLDTIADLQKLPSLLTDRGYSNSDVAAIMHGNWLRLLRRSWGSSSGFRSE